jgi:hypothetical protein
MQAGSACGNKLGCACFSWCTLLLDVHSRSCSRFSTQDVGGPVCYPRGQVVAEHGACGRCHKDPLPSAWPNLTHSAPQLNSQTPTWKARLTVSPPPHHTPLTKARIYLQLGQLRPDLL